MKQLLLTLFLFFTLFVFADNKNTKLIDFDSLTENQRLEYQYSFFEGVGSRISGDLNAALGWFDNCLKIYQSGSTVKYEIANILFLNEDYNGALYMIREAVKENPANVWYKLFLITILQKKSMIEEAGKVYDELISKYPDRDDYYLLEMTLYASIEKWEKAIEVLDKYEKQFGLSEEISFQKIKFYNQLNDQKKVSAELNKLITAFPHKKEYLSLLAEMYFSYNQDKKGLKILNNILKKDPDNGFVHMFMADYYISKKQYPEAEKSIRNALISNELDNTSKVMYIHRLIISDDSVHINDRLIGEFINILMQKYSNDVSVRILNANFLEHENKKREARDELEYIISQNKEIYGVWENLILLCNELSDTACMYERSMEAIKYFPEKPLPYIIGSIALMIQDDYSEKLLNLLKTGLQFSNDNTFLKTQFYSYLGDCYYKLDSVNQAFKMYDEVLKIEPENVVVLNNYAYYLALRNENLKQAEKMSYITVLKEPDNVTYLDTYAWVLYKSKDYSQALYYMKQVIEKSKEKISGVVYEHYGDILMMNNQAENALEMWEKALETGGEELSPELKYKINGTYKFER
ncbi:MAG: tetratricopeptide repeat protein [Culturomica sp.]|nr:tetratricopeptide repeat protein [Culturomica sp.]